MAVLHVIIFTFEQTLEDVFRLRKPWTKKIITYTSRVMFYPTYLLHFLIFFVYF